MSLDNEEDEVSQQKHHEIMFREKFFLSTVLSVPVLLYSSFVQTLFGFSMPAFIGSNLIVPVFSVIVFVYGGIPFLSNGEGRA